MLRFLTTAHTETLATAAPVGRPPHGFPEARRADPATAPEPRAVGFCFYGSDLLTGNRGFVDAFCEALHEAGAGVFAVWSYTLRRDSRTTPGPRDHARPDAERAATGSGRVPALELMAGQVD